MSLEKKVEANTIALRGVIDALQSLERTIINNTATAVHETDTILSTEKPIVSETKKPTDKAEIIPDDEVDGRVWNPNTPRPWDRPYASKKPSRAPRQEAAYKKAVKGDDAAEIKAAQHELAVYKLKQAETNLKRITNIEASDVAEVTARDMAIGYANADVAYFKRQLEVNEPAPAPTAPAPTAPAPTAPAPTAPAPTAPAPTALALTPIDTHGCPDGYMLADDQDSEFTYESYIYEGSSWTNDLMISNGIMVAIPEGYVSSSVSDDALDIDKVRSIMRDMARTKSSEKLISIISVYASSLDDVAESDYPKLVADLRALPDEK